MITTLLTIALVSSMIINVIFAWYTRRLLNYLEMTNDEARQVFVSLAEYEKHLTDVYGRDIFYGDATLEALLEHTSQIADEMQSYIETNQELTDTELETNNA